MPSFLSWRALRVDVCLVDESGVMVVGRGKGRGGGNDDGEMMTKTENRR